MDYKKFGDSIYARFNRGDEIISGIIDICRKENGRVKMEKKKVSTAVQFMPYGLILFNDRFQGK